MDDMLVDPEVMDHIKLWGSSYRARTGLPPVVTLCGSTKFKEEFLEVNKEFTLHGIAVLTVGCFPHTDDETEPEVALGENVKELVDKLHLQKINISDAIFVINVDGYIGSSTKNEIRHAVTKGIPIYFLEEENPEDVE